MIFYVISENKENTKTEFTEIWCQWWTKRDFVFCSCEHECKSYHSNFGGKLTGNVWLIADKSTLILLPWLQGVDIKLLKT